MPRMVLDLNADPVRVGLCDVTMATTAAQSTKVDGRATKDQIRNMLNLDGVAQDRRYQELQVSA